MWDIDPECSGKLCAKLTSELRAKFFGSLLSNTNKKNGNNYVKLKIGTFFIFVLIRCEEKHNSRSNRCQSNHRVAHTK
jgi:hypothetical protein